tara:strand:- start:4546 stop:5574 length:1029 start_codon:yes stop_codon:yes gene_type:complete
MNDTKMSERTPRMILRRSDVYVPPPGLSRDDLTKKLKQQGLEIKKMKLELILKNQKIKNLEKSVKHTNSLKKDKSILKENNKMYFDRIFKVLNIILNYQNVKHYSLYGSFIENLLSKKKLEFTTLNIFLKDLDNIEDIYGLLNILYLNDYIYNKKDFDMTHYYSFEQDNIPFYNLEIDLLPGFHKKTIQVRIHSFNYLRNITCSTRNIEINQYGINGIYNLDRELMASNISGLNILKTIENTMRSETVIYRSDEINKNLIENQEQLFSLLSTQLDCINDEWIVKNNGFHCIIDQCSVCLEKKKIFELSCHHSFCINCLHQHINHQSIHNKKCPLCRREMILQ